MTSKRILDSTLAYLVRYTPSFLGRHRHRYRFYQRIKSSDLRLHGRLKHSRVKLALNLGDWIQYWLFMDGAYERDLVGFLYPRVKDKVLFDVGANVESYTLTLAGNARHVYSFEASSSNVTALREFIRQSALDNVELVHRAVSDVSGKTVSLFTSPDTGGNNSQFYDYGEGCETATTVTLDQFAAENMVERVDIIKLDIEGGELGALRGAEGILREWHRLLLVEFNALVAAPAGWESRELYELICKHGYAAYQLRKGKLVAFQGDGMSAPDFYANLIFLQPSS